MLKRSNRPVVTILPVSGLLFGLPWLVAAPTTAPAAPTKTKAVRQKIMPTKKTVPMPTLQQVKPSSLPNSKLTTSDWLLHYLPEDRYKVRGRTWLVVSTELDTFYHRPECPNMLRQSPDIVLGFASVGDAEEAGYRPDPHCRPGNAFEASGTRFLQRRHIATAPPTLSLNDPRVLADPLVQEIAQLNAEIEAASTSDAQRKIMVKLLLIRARYGAQAKELGRVAFTRDAQKILEQLVIREALIGRLITAMKMRVSANPAARMQWQTQLEGALSAAATIARDGLLTPAQRTQETQQFVQKMLDIERSAMRNAPSRSLNGR